MEKRVCAGGRYLIYQGDAPSGGDRGGPVNRSNLHITDPGFEADGVYYAARPGKMRIDVSAGGKHVFTEAFDGQRGWEWARQETNERGIGVNRPT